MRLVLVLSLAASVVGLIAPRIDASLCSDPLVKDEPVCVEILKDIVKFDSVIGLFNRVSGHAIRGSTTRVSLEPLDGVLLDAYIGMFADSPSAELEARIASWAQTSSFGLLEAIFDRFVTTLKGSVVARLTDVATLKLARKAERESEERIAALAIEGERKSSERASEYSENSAMQREEEVQHELELERLELETQRQLEQLELEERDLEQLELDKQALETQELAVEMDEELETTAVAESETPDVASTNEQRRLRKKQKETAAKERRRARAIAAREEAVKAATRNSQQHRLRIARNEYVVARGLLELTERAQHEMEDELDSNQLAVREIARRLQERFAPLIRAIENLRPDSTNPVEMNPILWVLQHSLTDAATLLSACEEPEAATHRGAILRVLVTMRKSGLSGAQMWAVCQPALAEMQNPSVLAELGVAIETKIAHIDAVKQHVASQVAEVAALTAEIRTLNTAIL